MDFRELTPAGLEAFITSEEYRQMLVIPISPQRAISHIHNPRVDADDMILLLAYEEEKLVGYLGVLADRLYVRGQARKAGWLSCMWVDPEQRGKGIAKQLLSQVLDAWGQRILVTEFTQAAKGLYDFSGAFDDLKKAVGVRAYMRFPLGDVLPRKKPFLKYFKPVFDLTDNILNAVVAVGLGFWQFKPQLDWEVIHEIDESLGVFIEARQEKQLMRRSAEDINWMIKYPWLLGGVGEDRISRRYHFSAVEKKFEVINLRLVNKNGETIGYIMFTVRGLNLKIPYLYMEKGLEGQVAKLIFRFMKEKKLRVLTVFHPDMVNYIRSHRNPFLHIRKAHRHYIISKIFGPVETDEVEIQDGDADCGFT
ncbi:MAG: GNAT family N-acetyltransferase [Bacteroidia bacterium]|nr:GNAT family N-acetyltransferase [Bacteroidia bacterium]